MIQVVKDSPAAPASLFWDGCMLYTAEVVSATMETGWMADLLTSFFY